ncbi:hypothetical protein SAY86_031291 [Trapa natans]|uniref:CRAL-TRIO domain-containing protein n=1 Tax=Trapa natans TaxID=22666 RepID=A0AAN7R9J6_TRANT|nr:hypothetical protein SAY86_031291 [Trapa natans]
MEEIDRDYALEEFEDSLSSVSTEMDEEDGGIGGPHKEESEDEEEDDDDDDDDDCDGDEMSSANASRNGLPKSLRRGDEPVDDESVEIMRQSRKNKALLHFRCRVEDAILGNYLLGGSPEKILSVDRRRQETYHSDAGKEPMRSISLWGIPLLPSAGHEGTDVVLLKFLKASDFKVSEAFHMLRSTLRWREENKVDGILDEKFPAEMEKLVYISGADLEGRPICYHAYGRALRDKDSYKRVFGSSQKCRQFFRWTVHFMERSVRRSLSLRPGGVDSMVHIMDLKNLQKSSMKEIRGVLKNNFVFLQDNYPELIHKHVMINVPFWYYTYHVLILRFIHQSNRDKFIFARPSRVTKTLLKFVAPQDLPVQYGGLKKENDNDFTQSDKVSETIVGKNSNKSIQIPVNETGVTVTWDLTVVKQDNITYKEEFVPEDECSYKILIRRMKKLEGSIRNSFYINEPGKIVISIDNPTYKKKRVYYRSKIRPTMYIFFKS